MHSDSLIHSHVNVVYHVMAFMLQGIITAPILYAMEEFPQLHEVVDSGFDNPANVELVSNYFSWRTGLLFFTVHLPIG
jgi:hypothetical protein